MNDVKCTYEAEMYYCQITNKRQTARHNARRRSMGSEYIFKVSLAICCILIVLTVRLYVNPVVCDCNGLTTRSSAVHGLNEIVSKISVPMRW